MYRGCAATGRLFHQFDRETHRCKCGRWQAGFAPKKVSKTPRDVCQVCEREQALTKAGLMVHHGYERPGDGWIRGDCFGVGHKPFPAYDALVLWHDAVESEVGRTIERAAKLPAATELPYTYNEYLGHGQKRPAVKTIRVGDRADYSVGIPSFESHLAFLIRQNDSHLANVEAERVRVAARIIRALETK